MTDSHLSEYIIEYYPLGNLVKVSAVDPLTLTEVSISLPAKGLTQKEMSHLAVQKLEYVLRKKAEGNK